jgi:hypothetical protein
MIARTDLDRFVSLVRRDNTGTTGWTRGRSSLRFTLDAIEAYWADEHLPKESYLLLHFPQGSGTTQKSL